MAMGRAGRDNADRIQGVAMGTRVELVSAVAAALVLMDGFGVPLWVMGGTLPLLAFIAVIGYHTQE